MSGKGYTGLSDTPLTKWSNKRLAEELRFRLRFENAGTGEMIDMHSRILCEAVARILERLPAPPSPSHKESQQ